MLNAYSLAAIALQKLSNLFRDRIPELRLGSIRDLEMMGDRNSESIQGELALPARIPERVRTFVDFLAQWFGKSGAVKSLSQKKVARGRGEIVEA
jgi:hypothetical protein